MRLAAVLLCLAPLCAQDFSDLKMERVSAGHRFTEGPVWSPEGYLLFSDVPNSKILKFVPGKGTEVARQESNGANGNAIDSEGRLYTCENRTRRVIRMDKRGKVVVLAERWEGKRLNAPNDIVVRRDGHVWFTDPAFGSQSDGRELDFYGVYRLAARGKLEAIARWKTRPNGIAITPDQKTLYVANSDERTITAWDLDRGGAVSNERVVVRGIDGAPDGIKVDGKGNIWVACRVVAVYAPKGARIRVFEVGETPANLAFGAGYTNAYVTARTSIYRIGLAPKGAESH